MRKSRFKARPTELGRRDTSVGIDKRLKKERVRKNSEGSHTFIVGSMTVSRLVALTWAGCQTTRGRRRFLTQARH